MTTVSLAIEVASHEVGVSEDPPGSNRTLYGEWFGVQTLWCAVFLSWVASALGLRRDVDYPHTASVMAVKAWGERNGRIFDEPKPGDWACYWFRVRDVLRNRYNHVGIVALVHADGTFDAVEGNSNGKGSSNGGSVVYQTGRQRKYVGRTLFVRPFYKTGDTYPPIQLPRKAKTVFVTRGSGRKAVVRTDGLVKVWCRTETEALHYCNLYGQTGVGEWAPEDIDSIPGAGNVPIMFDAAGNVTAEGWDI